MPDNKAIAAQMMRIINKFIFLEKKSVLEYRGIRLFPSEIHLMAVIDEEQATNATVMANKLGITKGAVSQTFSRLEKKGILTKIKDPYNKNELTAYFTETGKCALKEHRKLRASLQAEYEQYFSSLSKQDRNVIQSFLSHVEHFADRLS